jgi:hypothetical protein
MIENFKSKLKNYNFRTSLTIGTLLILGVFVFIATSSPTNFLFKGSTEVANLPSSSTVPTEATPHPSSAVMGANTTAFPSKIPSPSKTPSAIPSSTPYPSSNPSLNPQTGSTSQSSSAPQSSATSQPSPSPTSQPEKKQVNVEIQSPDGNNSFQIEITDGMNVCDVVQKAKDQGRINSLTIDDQYLASLNSKYVYEINGHKNNWTFKINGNSPLGCSLYQVKANDQIVWKFN